MQQQAQMQMMHAKQPNVHNQAQVGQLTPQQQAMMIQKQRQQMEQHNQVPQQGVQIMQPNYNPMGA